MLVFNWFSVSSFCQNFDQVWVVGLGDGKKWSDTDISAVMFLNFSNGVKPQISFNHDINFNFFVTSASICDSAGHLQFYSNGAKINSHNHQTMLNGDSISIGSNISGVRAPQGALALPFPSKKGRYVLFNIQEGFFDNNTNLASAVLYANIIDMSGDNNLGIVVKKQDTLMVDTMEWGRILAVKHANGRDWWVTIPEDSTNGLYIFLLDPSGVHFVRKQKIGTAIEGGLGQAAFSPDGRHYARAKSTRLTEFPQFDLYDFDRCSGLLSNQRTVVIEQEGFGIGVAFSPDSRYLYIQRTRYSYQFDLWAPDLEASKTLVAEWNGFISTFAPSYFFLSQLAPDGRIYVGGTNGNRHYCYINFPNRPGLGCQFVQYGLRLPMQNRYTIPNHPNYRLGPLDGSPCDTLGLDNHPLANFRWEHEDSTELLRVTFTDLSAYEPESWQWDFGDGTASMERYPVHDYPKEGVYNACLIAKNRFSSDTFCQKVYLGVSAQDNPDLQSRIEVWPNPFSDRLVLALSTPELRGAAFRLFDATGRLVREMGLEYGINEVEAGELAKGLYFWAVEKKGERVKSGKMVKM